MQKTLTLVVSPRRMLLTLLLAVVGLAGLGVAYSTYRRDHRPWPSEAQLQGRLQRPGTAPAQVQAEVRGLLQSFAAGYERRDVARIDSFVAAHFDAGEDLLMLGTDGGEWSRGSTQVRDFIRGDWLGWGDLRLETANAIVSGDGQTAWVATLGTVYYPQRKFLRPVRFTAIAVRGASGWRFRQVQFQWEGGTQL